MNVRHITIPIGLKYKLFKSRNEIFQLNLRGKYQLNFLTKAKANVQIVQYENPFGINFWLPYSVVGNTVYDSVLQNYFEDVNNDFYSFFQAGLDLDIFLSKKVNLGLGFNWTHINNSPSSLLASPIKGVGMSFAFKYVFSKKDKQILPLK